MHNELLTYIATLGAKIAPLLGGMDGALYALLVFVVVDYITGVLRAVANRSLCSKIGARGIARKIVIFLMVAISTTIDAYLLGGCMVLRTSVIFFYTFNEFISITENAGSLGVPVPKKILRVLETCREKYENATTEEVCKK